MLMIKGLIAQSILAVLMVISFYTFYEVNVHYKICPYLKWLNVMLLVLTIYGLIPVIGGWTLVGYWQQETTRAYVYLERIYQSTLPIFAFFYFTQKGRITEKNLKHLFFILLVFSILAFYQSILIRTARTGREEITNNMGYFFVPLIPMLLITKLKDVWKYLFLVIIMAYLMMSMKRGAILSGSVMLLLFIFHHFKGISLKRLCFISCLSIIVIFAIYKFTINLYDNSYRFKKRVEQTTAGYTSHRDEIYASFFEYFISKTTSVEFFIGNGANATLAMFGRYAHNDWLEFAICQGIFGVMLYFVYWMVFWWEWKNYRGPTNCKRTLGDLIIAYFLITFFSMSIDNMPIAATLCIGYCLALNIRQKQMENLEQYSIYKNVIIDI